MTKEEATRIWNTDEYILNHMRAVFRLVQSEFEYRIKRGDREEREYFIDRMRSVQAAKVILGVK